jgi:hypothetical protein
VEKDASVLQLQKEAEAVHTDLEKERKQVSVKLQPPTLCLLIRFDKIRSRLTLFSVRFEESPGESASHVGVLQAAYDSSQQDLGLLEQAALDACQSIDEGTGPSGSSVASHLRALGGHVAEHMKGALRLGIQKTLGVVTSHYVVDLATLAMGYIVANDLDLAALAMGYIIANGAQDVVDQLDAATANTTADLTDTFE